MASRNTGVQQNPTVRKQIIKNIRSECKDFKRLYDKTYADVAMRTITRAAYTIMSLYYKSYRPKKYKRTYKLRDKSYAAYYDPRSHSGGVRINQDQSQPYYVKKIKHKDGTTETIKRPASLIWGNSWREGFHGYPEQGIPYEGPETLDMGKGTPLQQQERFCNRRKTQELVALETLEIVNKKGKFKYVHLKAGTVPFQKQRVELPKPTQSSEEGE